ncbi:MAG: hypothetical protein H8M99_09400 [Gloeobacteraceae cyanobacterium ES-bin-144]|nr:hypothetical protein [Verrucomicrobiales bacterium]
MMKNSRVLVYLLILSPVLNANTTFYVASNGRDSNAGDKERPFATIERARDEVRKLSRPVGLVEVIIRGGVYELEKALKFDSRDSGTAYAKIFYRAAAGEKPIIIGGKKITNWLPDAKGVFKADLAKQGIQNDFSQMFFDGRRMHLARYPNFDPQNPYGAGWAYADGKPTNMYNDVPGENKRTLLYKADDSRSWAHPEDGQVFVFPRYNWWNNIVPIQSINRDQRTITLAEDCSYPVRAFDRYYVQGMR